MDRQKYKRLIVVENKRLFGGYVKLCCDCLKLYSGNAKIKNN